MSHHFDSTADHADGRINPCEEDAFPAAPGTTEDQAMFRPSFPDPPDGAAERDALVAASPPRTGARHGWPRHSFPMC